MRGCWMVGACCVLFASASTGCGGRSQDGKQAGPPADEKPAPPETVFLLAAASTQEPIETIVTNYQRSNPSVAIRCSFAGSSILAQQIDSGADADLFLSANEPWAQHLADEGLVAERTALLRNRLVLIVPVESDVVITKPEDLLKDAVRHLAMADPDAVPAGIYGRQALEKLNLWGGVQDKVVAGSDVRQALSYVETGAAEAGIVYATDAIISEKVKTAFPFALDLTEPVVYPLVLLKSAADKPAAEAFYKHLQSGEALGIFRQQGFGVVERKPDLPEDSGPGRP
ncbi:MAG TPA: molybdate ABC transporter substrate-binding protein [Pirellulales bacterium]|nr:molybdate ABC transporter substrate-binding protein [Pirellulales bacterium]